MAFAYRDQQSGAAFVYAGTLAPVIADLSASFAVRALVSANLTVAYNLHATVSADLSVLYQVAAQSLTPVSADLACAYAVHAQVSASLMAAYAVAGTASSNPLVPNPHQTYVGCQRVREYRLGTMNFSPKRYTEVEVFTVDFAPLLATGEAITSAVWTNTAVEGKDPQASAMIEGVATVTGSKVSQLIGIGVPGVRYAPICTAQTSKGQTLILPEYGQGLLDVTL